ncbi:hypothetical protein [Anatilimnocola floriformis]|uniref:hypothetical protein n=1 Tax=Anatilimnocola floriformis TaxID=2948575 RepID=UPI0020C2D02F|nr:hypothetical protein [Anatilimnocola floriformis]
MLAPDFQPGFRISAFDGGVLMAGAVASAMIWSYSPLLAFLIAYVIGHFFLFCNVLRVSRANELKWSALLLLSGCCSALFGLPTWPATISLSLGATAIVIAITLGKPSYHGLGWQRINPRLLEWWERSQVKRN